MAKKVNKAKAVDRWNPAKTTPHKNSGEVITKPNQSQSIREILFRNTQGMTYDNYKTPYYEDQATFSSQSLNKIQEMEPVEKLQYLKQVSEQVNNLQAKIKEHEDAKAAKIAAASTTVTENAQESNENSSE